LARGRKPKSVERQIAEGDPRRHGKNKLEQRLRAGPKAAPGLPSCPRHLKGRARHAWTFWAAELVAMKLDKRPDGPMLEGACRAYERAVKADLLLDKEGWTFQDKTVSVTKKADGEEIKSVSARTRTHPAIAISHKAWMLVKAFCSEFGLSPVSRTRLSIENAPDDSDELAALLTQPRRETANPLVN
jgi:P27 family predicted phage terminase small subunit